ncbi:restriction endonuclease subunit S [Staphylococcus pseudintermedius]|uniref:restriction endonuclease subunit S n=1 Tax=Staphylococcus pseudintermedius TaxID=283734 RepID=UPI0036F310F6
MTEITNTPDLRFPEFNDKWQRINLSNIVTKIKGNDNQIDLPILTISAKYGWLTQKERFSQVIAGNSLKRYTKVSRGDVSYNKGNSKIAKYGIVYKMNYDEALVPNVYKSFRPHKGINSSFIEKYFHTKKLDRQLRKYISSTARMDGLLNISDNDFYKVNIYIPNSFEQEKIGDFFSKLDRQIELEEQKLAKLEEQKKGYMQKIFSQELRFKDKNGKQYPESKEYKLSEVGKFNSGIGFPEDLQGGTEGVPFFKVSDMNNKGNEMVMQKSNNYVSDEVIDSKKWKVITAVPSMIFAKVGAAIMLNRKRLVLEPFLIDNNTMSYSFSNNWDTSFGRVLFQTIYLPKYAQVGALPSYNAKDIGTIKVKLPTKQEQEKIGTFFNKIDNLIELQANKVDLLKQRKQGLLQKMFV